jgi:hypothetical protein
MSFFQPKITQDKLDQTTSDMAGIWDLSEQEIKNNCDKYPKGSGMVWL